MPHLFHFVLILITKGNGENRSLLFFLFASSHPLRSFILSMNKGSKNAGKLFCFAQKVLSAWAEQQTKDE